MHAVLIYVLREAYMAPQDPRLQILIDVQNELKKWS